jgi:ABC-2 type transport system permease protein
VQFLPAVVLPQFLLCGLLLPRDQLPDVLHAISNVLPLSYAVDAATEVTSNPEVTSAAVVDICVVLGFAVAAVVLGAATLRRRTP